MGKWWTPPSERPALTVQIPDEWETEQIASQDELIELLTLKLQALIEDAYDPEETLGQMVRDLENASILGYGMTDLQKLAEGEYWEVNGLLTNPEMTYLLMQKAGVPEGQDRLTWPQTATEETPENGADEMTLEEWANSVTAGMYVPSWE